MCVPLAANATFKLLADALYVVLLTFTVYDKYSLSSADKPVKVTEVNLAANVPKFLASTVNPYFSPVGI